MTTLRLDAGSVFAFQNDPTIVGSGAQWAGLTWGR